MTFQANAEQEGVRLSVWLVTGGMILGALSGVAGTGVRIQQPVSAIRNVTDWTSSGAFITSDAGASTDTEGLGIESINDIGHARIDLSAAVTGLHDESGLTWNQLSKLFGVSRRALHHWAAGGRMNAAHAERLAALVTAVRQVGGETPGERRARLLAPQENGRSMYDIMRSLVERGVPVGGTPYQPEALLSAMHDRGDQSTSP
ncbi:hypothetical protein OHR68_30330 [Spirillospora sp. NBC_00431]